MAEYLIQDTSLTPIADKIREIQGSTSGLTPSAMNSNLSNIINHVDSQHDQIQQIKTLLNEKLPGKATVGTVNVTPRYNTRNITFTGVPAEPSKFIVIPISNITLSSTSRYVIAVGGGNSPFIITGGNFSTTSTASSTGTGFSYTYNSNGSLTINTTSTTDGGYFRSGVTYQLIYTITPIFGQDVDSFFIWGSSTNTQTIQLGPFPSGMVPSSFQIIPYNAITLSDTSSVTAIACDGNSIKGCYSNRSTNTASSTTFNFTFNNNYLTINSTNGYFVANVYYLIVTTVNRV